MKGSKNMNINEITIGMTPQEKDIYFAHQEKRHREEQEKLEQEKAQLKTYREKLISDILESNKNFSCDELKKMRISTLERISGLIALLTWLHAKMLLFSSSMIKIGVFECFRVF